MGNLSQRQLPLIKLDLFDVLILENSNVIQLGGDDPQDSSNQGVIQLRISKKNQSNPQKVWQLYTGAKFTKNIPAKLKVIIGSSVFFIEKDKLQWNSLKGFINFVRNSELSSEQLVKLFDLHKIQEKMEISKKLGSSKKIDSQTETGQLLTYMYKQMLKITYQSVRRMIPRVLQNLELTVTKFLDQEAQVALKRLDKDLRNHQKYSDQYRTLVRKLK